MYWIPGFLRNCGLCDLRLEKKPNNLQNSTPLPFWLRVLTSYFLVARMIMISQKFLKEPPLKGFYSRIGERFRRSKDVQVKRKHIDPIDVIDGIL